MAKRLKILFEPYAIRMLDQLLAAFADRMVAVQYSAADASKVHDTRSIPVGLKRIFCNLNLGPYHPKPLCMPAR